MNLIRIAWAIVALGLISVVTCAPFLAGKAEAAEVNIGTTTLADISAVIKLFPNARLIIRDTRTIIIWNAATNTVSQCYIARAPWTLSKLGQTKTGYRLEQFMISTLSGVWTQDECYAVTIPAGF